MQRYGCAFHHHHGAVLAYRGQSSFSQRNGDADDSEYGMGAHYNDWPSRDGGSRNQAELRRCNSTSVAWKMAGRRSRAAEFPNGDAEAFRLVGEVVLDSRAREMHDADRQ